MEFIQQNLPILIMGITPFVVEAVKVASNAIAGKVPKFLIPLIAAIIGAAADVFVAGGSGMNGVIAGAASTGVRDVVVHAKNSMMK